MKVLLRLKFYYSIRKKCASSFMDSLCVGAAQ